MTSETDRIVREALDKVPPEDFKEAVVGVLIMLIDGPDKDFIQNAPESTQKLLIPCAMAMLLSTMKKKDEKIVELESEASDPLGINRLQGFEDS